jgi:hypothetical protein
MLTLDNLINHFSKPKQNSNTFEQFLKTTKVRVGTTLHKLEDYTHRKNISTDAIKTLFSNIQNRNEYLTRFYKTSLQIPTSLKIADEPMRTGHMNNNQAVNYKRVIRNLFFKEILKETQSGLENSATFLQVLEDLYLNNIIDYKILTPSAIYYTKNGRLGSVFSSYYFRASIMNPFLVYSLNQSVLNGTRIFTPTLGWSSYCYGFLECDQVVEYVGTDVIESVCNKTHDFAKTRYPNKTVDIYCMPSEKLAKNKAFMKKYKNHFDVIFFSPPYYRLELYPGDNQSTSEYKTYEEWLHKYWEQTIYLCNEVLKKGGKMCYILSGYGQGQRMEDKHHEVAVNGTGKNVEFDLLRDMNIIVETIFKTKPQVQNMYNKNVNVTSHRETAEKIMIFEK